MCESRRRTSPVRVARCSHIAEGVTRHTSRCLLVVMLVASGGVFADSDLQADATVPAAQAVSWSSHFDPEGHMQTIDDVRVSMDAPWLDTLLVTPGQGDTREPIALASCSGYLAVRHRRVWANSPDHAMFQSRAVRCVAADLLLNAQPFAVDHLGALVFDATLPARLPVGVASIPSATEHARVLADPAMRTWSDYAGPMTFESKGALSGTYREKNGGQSMTLALIARGDFNGDGIGDALLQSHEAAEGGSWRASRLFLVTQRTQDGAIGILETFDTW